MKDFLCIVWRLQAEQIDQKIVWIKKIQMLCTFYASHLRMTAKEIIFFIAISRRQKLDTWRRASCMTQCSSHSWQASSLRVTRHHVKNCSLIPIFNMTCQHKRPTSSREALYCTCLNDGPTSWQTACCMCTMIKTSLASFCTHCLSSPRMPSYASRLASRKSESADCTHKACIHQTPPIRHIFSIFAHAHKPNFCPHIGQSRQYTQSAKLSVLDTSSQTDLMYPSSLDVPLARDWCARRTADH